MWRDLSRRSPSRQLLKRERSEDAAVPCLRKNHCWADGVSISHRWSREAAWGWEKGKLPHLKQGFG
jgi:hypothetical protein